MASPTEVEIKFRIADLSETRRKLLAASFRLKTERTHEMNTLYDSADGSIRQRGDVLRIRKYGDIWKLTHKSKGETGKHKSRVEVETQVADGEKLAEIFRWLGLEISFRYEKFRTEFTDGIGDVVLDETPIGNFGEIEGPADWIDTTARDLQLAESEYLTESYAQLFEGWKQASNTDARDMTFQSINATSSPKA
jgi:adenylate cyclase class 2